MTRMFPSAMGIAHPPQVVDDGETMQCPEWARAAIWLGWWCRKQQLPDHRILAVCVVPARELVAAFVGMGCLIAGAQGFDGGLTWDQLRAFPPGTEVFWKSGNRRYSGTILSADKAYADLVSVRIVTGNRADVSAIWRISEETFDQYPFSDVKLPTRLGSLVIEDVIRFLGGLGITPGQRWGWAGGLEALILTSKAGFLQAVAELKVAVQGSVAVPLQQALCLSSDVDGNGKLLVQSRLGDVERPTPISVIDGPEGCDRIDQIRSGNVLLLLSRSEYSARIDNYLREVRQFDDPQAGLVSEEVPDRFPPGFEMAAYFVPRME